MKYYVVDEDNRRVGETTFYEPEASKEVVKDKVGCKIALVVGHTSSRQGAYGNKGIGEWEFNKDFVNDMVLKLPKQHEYYVLYRKDDIKGYTNQMLDVHKQSDKIGCKYAIEFHFNGASDSSVNGNEVLYCRDEAKGKELAEILDRCFDELPNRDRGIKPVTMRIGKPDDNGAGFCCRGNAVSIIAEPFFASHQDKFVYNTEGRKTLFKAYYSFFNQI